MAYCKTTTVLLKLLKLFYFYGQNLFPVQQIAENIREMALRELQVMPTAHIPQVLACGIITISNHK